MMPEGWLQAKAPEGVSVMAVNAQEEITEAKAKEIGFKAYFAVSHNPLQGKSLAEGLQVFKEEVAKLDSGAVFLQERETSINNREARAAEIKMIQQEIDFRVWVVMVKGNNDDVWIITFNTLESKWNDYQNLFSEVANSFQLK